MNYFSYDPAVGGYGFELHATAEQAKARAAEHISQLKNDHDGFWEDAVNEVCWGEIKEAATPTNVINVDETGRGEDGEVYDTDVDYVCDYELQPIENKKLDVQTASLALIRKCWGVIKLS